MHHTLHTPTWFLPAHTQYITLPKANNTTNPPNNSPVQIISAQMPQAGSAMADSESTLPSQSPDELTNATNAITTETDALIGNKAPIDQPEAGHEDDRSERSPISSLAAATSGLEVGSSSATSYPSTPRSPSSSYDSVATDAGDSATFSGRSSPSSPTVFPGPLEKAALKSSESSESAIRGDLERSRGLKRSREVRDTSDGEEDDAPTRHRQKVVRSSEVSPTREGVAAPYVAAPGEHTSSNLKRSRATITRAAEDQDELPHRNKIARTTAYVGLTGSEDEAAPENVIDLTGSGRGASPVPSQQIQQSYLHRLPGELRNRIYRYIGLSGPRMELRNLEEPALSVAIPDLKHELHSFMFSANKLRVPIYTGFRADTPPDRSKPPTKRDSLGEFNNSHTAPGKIGIAPDSWVMQVDPRFVTIKHICLRVLESHSSDGGHKLVCDYFVNVSCKDGEMRVSGKNSMKATDALRRTVNHMSNLATERAKQCAKQEGFEGFTWEQVQHIAASFVSVADARSRYTKKGGKATLLEGMN
jgi:hypothetical protein